MARCVRVFSSLVCVCVVVRRFDFSPSQLKSLLQKNIRMSRPMAAVRSALQLAVRAGLNELLRRLSVIMLEDAVLHPLTPLLMWLTLVCGEKRKDGAGSSNISERRDDRGRVLGKDGAAENRSMCHPPTLQLLNAVLLLVFDIAAVAVKDSSRTDKERGDAQAGQSPLSPALSLSLADADYSDVSAAQLLFVRCLLLRSHLGGMEGDMAMMRRYAALWTRRFAAENRQTAAAHSDSAKPAPRRWLPFLQQLFDNSRAKHATLSTATSNQPLSVLFVASLQDDDILLSAIDQHCSPLIDQLRAEHSRVRDRIAQHVSHIQHSMQQQPPPQQSEADADMESSEDTAASEGRVDVVRLLNAAIWRHRSSLTNKRSLLQSSKQSPTAEQQAADASYELFLIIKAEADQISRRIVAQKLRRY